MEFGILGPLQVTEGGHPVLIPPGKRRTLLVALLVHRNQVVSVQRLVDWIWGDEPPEDAASALQSHVSRLRAALGAPPGGEPVIATHGSGYELHSPVEAIDSVRFERLVMAARTLLPHDPGAAAATLREALALWRGRALDGLAEEPFAQAESLRLEEARLAAIEDLMECELARDRHVAVAGDLQSLVAEHPTRERLTALLMRALYRGGRQAEALSVYRRLRRRLVDELGIEPTLELRRLERAVLRQEVEETGTVPPPPGTPVPAAVPGVTPRQRLLPERTPFVGRHSERDELGRLVERALGGEGGLVMIGGEPGVGKSRLVQEVAACAPRPVRALIGHCYEAQGDLPFMPWVEFLERAAREVTPETLRRALGDDAPELARMYPALRRLFPDIPPPMELLPEQQRRYTFSSIRDYLERVSRMRPQLLVLEDLHWADEGTLLFTRFIAEHLPIMPCLVVGTYRDPPVDVSPQLAETLSHLVRERRARIITLRRHSEPEVGAMLGALTGQRPPPDVTAAIHAETEGNAFFVEEVYRHLTETGRLLDGDGRFRDAVSIAELDVPENVRLVTGRRLERLSDTTQRALAIAAVAGRHVDFELLEAIAEVKGDDLIDSLAEAERARLVVAESRAERDEYWFAHELIRQTLLTRLPAARRRRHHLRVADALARVYADDLPRHAADIAHHLLEAGHVADAARTVRYFTLAGDGAHTASAFEEALRHYSQALSILPEGDDRTTTELLIRIGRAESSLGHPDEAMASWRMALDRNMTLGEVDQVERLCYDIAWQLIWVGRFADSFAMTQRGLALLAQRRNAERARLLAVAAVANSGGGRFEASEEMLTEGLAIARTHGSPEVEGMVLSAATPLYWGHALYRGAVEAGRSGAPLLRESGAVWDYANMVMFLQASLHSLGRWEEAERLAPEVDQLAARVGNLGALLVTRRERAARERNRGADLKRYEEFARADLELNESASMAWISHFHIYLALLDFWRGNWESSLRHIRTATELEPPGVPVSLWSPAMQLLLTAYTRGGEETSAMFEQLRSGLPTAGRPNTIGAWQLLATAVEALSLIGAHEGAAMLHPLVVEHIESGVVFDGYIHGRLLQMIAGIAAAAGRRWSEAERHFEEALGQAAELGLRMEDPDIRRFYAAALLDRGGHTDRTRARRLLEDAIAGYRAIGMPRHVSLAEGLLARA